MIDCSSYTSGTITLEFDGNYQDFDPNPNEDFARVRVWDGNTTWQLVDTYSTSWASNGEHKVYDVSSDALGNVDFQVYFYYLGYNDWFFQVDNVKLTHTP